MGKQKRERKRERKITIRLESTYGDVLDELAKLVKTTPNHLAKKFIMTSVNDFDRLQDPVLELILDLLSGVRQELRELREQMGK